MAHTILTFITKVDPSKLRELEGVLDEIAADLTGNPHIPFGRLKRLHFSSLVILPPDGTFGPCLVFENNFDGPLGPYLGELIEQAGPGLDRIYRCCLGYAASGPDDRAAIASYLRAHVVRPNAWHIGNVGRSAERIRRESALRESLEGHLDELVRAGLASGPAREIRRRLQTFVGGDKKWDWAREVRPRLTRKQWLVPRLNIAAAALGALAASPVLLPIVAVSAVILRRKEATDSVWSGLPDHEHVRRLLEREDRTRVVQNHLANISPVKPGPFRRATLRVVLWLANLIARTSTNGTLSNIPSIHFAHWVLIDDDRRLLFMSNFDGSWENYLDDFIDKASRGLTAIWGNTVDFPRTRWLVLEGSRDGPNFKAIARARQVYTNVWYSAYRDLTVQQIDKNSTIREGLFAELDESAEKAWLRTF